MDTLLCKRYCFPPFVCKGEGCNLTEQQQQTFLRYALLSGVLADIDCGIIGSYVPDLPADATTIVLAGGVYQAVISGSRFLKRRHV